MDENRQVSIQPARTTKDLQDVRTLFAAYADWLEVDLTFQDFATELDSLPGKYAPPTGDILLARNLNDRAIGCVAVRPLGLVGGCCEMKRLYTLPEGRGLGIGRSLIKSIIDIATKLGYYEIKLDTLPSMTPAISLYQEVGFVCIDPYYENPIKDVVFLSKKLS
ncbi:MAG: hypothetical protein Q9217_004752 [Psora testacea]